MNLLIHITSTEKEKRDDQRAEERCMMERILGSLMGLPLETRAWRSSSLDGKERTLAGRLPHVHRHG